MSNRGLPGACPACGEPLRPGVKFCESCGAPVRQAPAFCTQCGSQLTPGTRFCGSCGTPTSAAASPPAAPAVVAQAPRAAPPPPRQGVMQPPQPAAPPAEPVLLVLSQMGLRKGILKFLEYNLIVTPRRLVLARVTTKMISDAAMEAKQAAREEGKGFMQQWAASTGARQYICDRYRQMEVESILAQDPESFALPLEQVREIRTGSDSDADDNTTEWLEIRSMGSKMRFGLQGGAAESARRALKSVLGELVR